MPSVLINGVHVADSDPSALYAPATGEGTKTGPRRSKTEKAAQSRLIKALTAHLPAVIYAVRLADGTIKIGCSSNFAQRLRSFRSQGGEVLGFRAGDFDDEAAIHDTLIDHRARGREYYHPTSPVLDVVNQMRDEYQLPHITR